jgi:HEPN domain-containing protein
MDRATLQKVALERVKDIKGLLKIKRWSAAYYLAGYVVECGLKSCIIAHLMRTDRFPDRRYSEQCWTHDLERLVVLADLASSRDAELNAHQAFAHNWTIVQTWSEATRYDLVPKKAAEELVAAITDPKHGVLVWIKRHW